MILFLVYHRIEDPPGSAHGVRPDRFEQHLRLLRKSDQRVLDPRSLESGGGNGVVLAFDDATEDHWSTVLPVLRQAGLRGIFYVPTGKLGERGYMTPDQLGELAESGQTIGSHAHSHTRLDHLSPADEARELAISAGRLRALVGRQPVHFAPPGGLFRRSTQESACRMGFRTFRTMRWGYNRIFDASCIEVVPMTDAWGTSLLQLAIQGRGDAMVKAAYVAKEWARERGGDAAYNRLRSVMLRVSPDWRPPTARGGGDAP